MENPSLPQYLQHRLDVAGHPQVFFIVIFEKQQHRIDAGDATRHILFEGAAVNLIFPLCIGKGLFAVGLHPFEHGISRNDAKQQRENPQ